MRRPPESFPCALAGFALPEIFNTDPGAQFTSADCLSVLPAHQIQISMDGRGCWRGGARPRLHLL